MLCQTQMATLYLLEAMAPTYPKTERSQPDYKAACHQDIQGTNQTKKNKPNAGVDWAAKLKTTLENPKIDAEWPFRGSLLKPLGEGGSERPKCGVEVSS